MGLKEFITGPELPKKLLKATIYTVGLVLPVGMGHVIYRVHESIKLDDSIKMEEKRLTPEKVSFETRDKVYECFRQGLFCEADANRALQEAQSAFERGKQNLFTQPAAVIECKEARLECLQNIQPQLSVDSGRVIP